MTVLEERGYFWWDDEPIPDGQIAPSSAVTGLLKISDEGSIDLELDGTMPSEQSQLQTFFERRIPASRRIRGLLKGSNSYALLCDLTKSGGQLKSNGVSYEHFHATKCLVGDSSATTGSQVSNFNKLEIELKGFEEWLWLRSIAAKRTETEFSANYQKPDDFTFSVEGGTLSIHYALYSPWGTHSTDTLNLREAVSLIYTAHECLQFDVLIDLYSHISDLFILLTGSNYSLDWPTLSPKGGEGTCKFYFQRSGGDLKPPTVLDWWIPFPQIKSSFGALFSNWRTKRNEYRSGFSLYLATRRSIRLYLEHRFMSLIWGIEFFHRKKYPDNHASSRLVNKISRILKAIKDALPKDSKWLADFLEHAHEPPLSKRIFEVFSALDIELEKQSLQRFSKSCADMRNDISHFGGHRQGGDYQQFLLDIYKKSNALACLYHVLLLKELGIDKTILRTAIYKGSQSFKIKTALSEAGLSMTSPEDTAAP